MFSKLREMFTGMTQEPKAPAHPEPTPAPRPTQSQARARDPISHPEPGSPWYDELMANRARDVQWGIAVAAKVDQWKMLIQLGSGHVVPEDYRMKIMQAIASNDFQTQSMIYNLVQTNIMRNYGSILEVKAL